MAIGTLTLGALLLAGGLGANAYVQNERSKNLSRNTRMILDNAKSKQAELDEERQELLGQALEKASVGRAEIEGRQRQKEADLVGRMEANVNRGRDPKANDPNSAGVNGPAGRVIGKAVSRESEANEAENSQKRTAMARLDSLGDVLSENNNIFRPAYGEIQANQRIAQGEEARMPLALQAAEAEAMSKKRGLEIAGQIAQGVGTGLLAGGAWGTPAAGAGSGVSGGTGAAVSANTAGVGAGTGTKFARIPLMVY
jgi:hypothetical protein